MTVDDFQMYYAGTFIKVRETGQILYLLQARSSGEVDYITVPEDVKLWSQFDLNSFDKTRVSMDRAVELIKGSVSPVYGYHNGLGDSVFYLALSPKRQNKKAMTQERYVLSVPNTKESTEAYIHGTGKPTKALENTYIVKFPVDVAVASFSPSYTALEDAARMLKTGERLGAALSEDLALVTKSNVRFPVLFYKERAIGIVKERVVRLFEEFQNYADAIKRSKNSINAYSIELEKGTL